MVKKLRVKSGEEKLIVYWYWVEYANEKNNKKEDITQIIKKKEKRRQLKMRKVNIKMRRNSEVRSVEIKESETKRRVAKKIQNKRERKWWYETKMSKKRQRRKWGLVVIFNEMPCFTFPFVDRLFKYFFPFNVCCPYGATFFFFFLEKQTYC